MQLLDLTDKTVFGVALNFKALMEKHQDEFNAKPYLAPPKTPVLFIKPPITYNSSHCIPLNGLEQLQTGANIAIVIGKTATCVSQAQALDYVAGITIANDYSAPIESYYRPAVVANCRDNSFSIADNVVPLSEIKDLNQLRLSLSVNGEEKQHDVSSNWVRNIPELIENITEFMTLHEGDVLLTGTPADNVYVKAGDVVVARIDGVCELEDQIVGELD